VALYGQGARRWTMTERGRRWVHRSADTFRVGPSRLRWTGQSLVVDIDEVAVPLPRRVRGRITLHPQALCTFSAPLDAAARHRWGPIAPCSRVEVEFDDPALRWQGHAYMDSNEGDEPIDRPFSTWDWSRATMGDGSTAVIYDVRPKVGSSRVIAQRFATDGSAHAFEPPARQALPHSLWRVGRGMRSAGPQLARVLQTLEDTPFYVRSTLQAQLMGESVTALHESLDLPRVVSWPVRMMLPFRMPRRS